MREESVYLGLGSNLGNRIEHLCAGLGGLRERGLKLGSVSSFYLTEPDLRPSNGETATPGGTDHPWYVNCVAAVDEAPPAEQLLNLCHDVEQEHGRSRHPASESNESPQPRTLDIDVLLIGARIIEEPSIRVPHPRMQDRRFVLAPLAEIAPQARHPVAGTTVEAMLDALPVGERVWLLAPSPSDMG